MTDTLIKPVQNGPFKEWTFIDKSLWPERGPWDSEPDKVQWTDEATGLPCLAVRARSHWCGYVGVAEGHPWFGVAYQDYEVVTASAHGGLTFSEFCQEGDHEPRICHVPEQGQPDRVWWFGFDCAHSGDHRPATTLTTRLIDLKYPAILEREQYRTLGYVKQQCRELAEQIKAAQ